MTKKFMNALRKLEGGVTPGLYNPLEHCLRTSMPSVNWMYGNAGGGIPFGYSEVLWGLPKGGKSLICNARVAELHRTDPEALAITFNTELRGQVQCNVNQQRMWGIDPDRFQVYDVNSPDLIFDRIEHEFASLCQDGAKIKAINIDSVTHIQGRRTMASNTIMQQQIGDHAKTISDGIKRIIPVIRKYNIALTLTDHARAELDPHEVMRGNTHKMASAFALKHTCEFFTYVELNKTKTGKTDLAGKKFEDESKEDFKGNAERTGQKIRMTLQNSSFGKGTGRSAEFTLDYNTGVINQHEEIFTLACNLGLISVGGGGNYKYKDSTWRGKESLLGAIRDDVGLQTSLMNEVWQKEYNANYYV